MRKAIGITLIVFGSLISFLLVLAFLLSLPRVLKQANDGGGAAYVIGYILGIVVFLIPAVGLIFWGIWLTKKRKSKLKDMLDQDLT